MLQICRICLREIKNQNFITLDDRKKSLQLKREISFCLPEISINLVKDPVLCESCVTSLHVMYVFQNKCLRTENIIKNYMYSNKLEVGSVSLVDFYENAKAENLQSSELQTCNKPVQSNRLQLPQAAVYDPNHDFIEDLNNALDKILENDTSGLMSSMQVGLSEQCLLKKETGGNNINENRMNIDYSIVKVEPVLDTSEERCLDLSSIFDSMNEEEEQVPDPTPKPCFIKLIPLQYQLFQQTTSMRNNEDNKTNLDGESDTRQNTLKKRISFPCKICSKKFSLQFHLLQHMKSHEQDRPNMFTCKKCNFTTSLQITFQIHMDMHKYNSNL
ncbi:hypothetical protein ILUMI_26130 [Ignelater luminosus]|uniref:C2H2-type domain-containing protein n=1 Tax=Ignelater luminosus TaxID=2038154 RepID=A0A8K0C768_IGNLU|nr:hypothetical protein ILUMI_26130 [Ignelater luminosus]